MFEPRFKFEPRLKFFKFGLRTTFSICPKVGPVLEFTAVKMTLHL